jgi:hypothetical protein
VSSIPTPSADGGPDDVLPDVSTDERALGWGDDLPDEDADLQRLIDDVPPHHG